MRTVSCKKLGIDQNARRDFAKAQMKYLVGLGYSNNHARAIMIAAGPGQVRLAIKWLDEAKKKFSPDTIDMVLTGLGGTHSFGKERVIAVLFQLGLPIPKTKIRVCFFGVLKGARAAVTGK